MLMGGTVPEELERSVHWLPVPTKGDYVVYPLEFKVDGKTAQRSTSQFAHTIVDSGTTFIYLPPTSYAAAKRYWTSSCPWGECKQRSTKGKYPDDYCYSMHEREMLAFRNMSISFKDTAGRPFDFQLSPRQYVYQMREGVWCLGIFDNKRPGIVIGGAAMRGHEVRPRPRQEARELDWRRH